METSYGAAKKPNQFPVPYWVELMRYESDQTKYELLKQITYILIHPY